MSRTTRVCLKDDVYYDVKIDRTTKWGNIFTHKKTKTLAKYIVNSRKEAVMEYEKWITEGDGKHLLDDLHELDGKILGCWCKGNQLCHGDVLIYLIYKSKLKGLPL